ncbi:transglycosylase SLT domain-containing protein [Limnohabitans sp. Rim8]|uniref:lytic transglycosylase domain-containing protein n=1 Tax=Limnohabitans sp. Rim8 TaxID=1100718 RepID=UPI0033060952
MQFPQILTPLAVLALTLVFSLPSSAQTKAGDSLILEMHEAFRKNDKARLTALLPQARDHALAPWAAFWELRARLDTASKQDIQDFLTRFAGTYQEDRLRLEWLKQLGKRRDWAAFSAEYPLYRMRDDKEVRCYALAAEAAPTNDAVAEFKRLWYAQKEADDGCNYAAEKLHKARKIDGLDLWRKARLAMEVSRPRAAQMAVEIEAKDVAGQVVLIQADPVKYLDKRIMAITTKRKELAVLALIRIAASNPDQAAEALHKRWGLMLSAEERNWAWGAIGKQAAFKLQDNASSYFAKVTRVADLNDDMLGWKVRAALRQGNWKVVASAIDAMQYSANDPAWVYWRTKATLASNPTEAERIQALQSLRNIASLKGFYEQLALEDSGQSITLPAKPTPLSNTEKSSASANPGLQRALYAIGMGLRAEGNREWNYSTNLHTPGGMSDRDLLAAADLACQRQVWDRCINTSERTKTAFDAEQRFPTPLRDTVLRKAKAVDLDPAFVYGLIRQESRFITDARSGVGAAGLMQVMPATARWTAKKIGLTDFTLDQLNDHEVNVAIGTGYLKLVLDDFGGSLPMAVAAYNAGPSRPRNWRNGPLLEGAIWAENIPFLETRDYVKKVLSNTTNYAALLTGQAQSLRARLGSVSPKPANAVEAFPDLP